VVVFHITKSALGLVQLMGQANTVLLGVLRDWGWEWRGDFLGSNLRLDTPCDFNPHATKTSRSNIHQVFLAKPFENLGLR